MIPLKILTLIVTAHGQPSILVLEPLEETLEPGVKRIIPIWIGTNEAGQLGAAIEKVKLPRPMTHDLFLDALTNLDARVDHVILNDLKGQTFFAKLYLRQGGRLVELDARPTDAISLALRQDAPFLITEELLERASYPYFYAPSQNPEEELREFRTFLTDLSPDDFEDAE